MPDFVENNSTLFAPWGGFKPCDDVYDCIVDGGTSYSLLTACTILNNPPPENSPVQKYCRCDLGMGGEFCTEITNSAYGKLGVQATTLLIGLIALAYGANELYKRSGAKKVTAVLAAVRFAMLSLLFNIFWSLFGVIFIVGGFHGPSLEAPRWIYTNMIIPLTFILTLTSVLILSLSWRKVVNDWRRYSMDVDAKAMELREKRFRRAIIVVVIVNYIGGAIAMAAGTIIYASYLTVSLYIATIVMFVISGKNFRRQINTSTQGTTILLTGEGNRITACLEFARQASRNATCSLALVTLAQILMVVVLDKLGYPTQPDEVEPVAVTAFFMQLGSILTGVFVVNYARQTRSLARKPRANTAGSYTAGTMETYKGSFDHSMNIVQSRI